MYDKNIVYCYNSKKELKQVKIFNTLEECFLFVSSEIKLYTKNVKIKNNSKNFLVLDLF